MINIGLQSAALLLVHGFNIERKVQIVPHVMITANVLPKSLQTNKQTVSYYNIKLKFYMLWN